MRLIPQAWTTDRLRVRRFTLADAAFVLALHESPDLARFIPSAVMTTLDEARRWIEESNHGQGRGWWCVQLIDGPPVAAVLLKPVRPSAGRTTDDVEIGWRQHPDHTGHGYVTEAARAVLRSALASGLPRVIAVTDPENTASQRVAVRIGMRADGTTDAYYDQTLSLFVARP